MFKNDYNHLVNHHLTSYNNFFLKNKNVMKDNNPLILKDLDEDLNDYNLKCYMYFGGKDGSKLYYGKPILYDNDYEHIMFQNMIENKLVSISIMILMWNL